MQPMGPVDAVPEHRPPYLRRLAGQWGLFLGLFVAIVLRLNGTPFLLALLVAMAGPLLAAGVEALIRRRRDRGSSERAEFA